MTHSLQLIYSVCSHVYTVVYRVCSMHGSFVFLSFPAALVAHSGEVEMDLEVTTQLCLICPDTTDKDASILDVCDDNVAEYFEWWQKSIISQFHHSPKIVPPKLNKNASASAQGIHHTHTHTHTRTHTHTHTHTHIINTLTAIWHKPTHTHTHNSHYQYSNCHLAQAHTHTHVM